MRSKKQAKSSLCRVAANSQSQIGHSQQPFNAIKALGVLMLEKYADRYSQQNLCYRSYLAHINTF